MDGFGNGQTVDAYVSDGAVTYLTRTFSEILSSSYSSFVVLFYVLGVRAGTLRGVSMPWHDRLWLPIYVLDESFLARAL